MSKAFTVDELAKGSADFQRLNAGVMGAPAPVMQERKPKKAAQIIHGRTRLDRCNKTELRFYREWLERDFASVVIVQPPRLFELEGGGTYTPDFVEVRPCGVVVWEVKGGYRGPGWEQGIERFKRAAAQYDGEYLSFALATWDSKEKRWRLEGWRRK
jgi:hypothetical protein